MSKQDNESFEDQLSRVEQMATGDPTWDLSDNDIAALKAVLSDRRKLLVIVKGDAADDGTGMSKDEQAWLG